jgi:putative MATE family efflux protein
VFAIVENSLLTSPIPSLVKKIALPSVVGFFFNTMYNVVDTYFGGKVSTEALAALSLSFPVFFLLISFSSGMATGTTTLITNAIGEGKNEEAKQYATQTFSYGILLSVFLTFVGILFSPSIFKLLGAEGNYLVIALSYINPIFYGALFFIVIAILNAILQSIGNTKIFRNFLIFGFFLNCILDPWFLYGGFGLPAFGFPGIAFATVVVQIIGCFYIGYHATKSGLISFSKLHDFKPRLKIWREITAQVLPASMNMLFIDMKKNSNW